MPRTALPPTPASSTDIHGRDGTKQLSALRMAVELPEPAINNPARSHATASFSPVSPVSTSSSKAPYPIQPSEAVKARRRSSAAAAARERGSINNSNDDAFALPPPPMRSRRIIQMKPKTLQDDASGPEIAPAPSTTKTTSGKSAGKRTATAALVATETEPSSSKKKQPSPTSAAGRKIARKTAHSLIERRRRSKMNEEFGVLKDMIPACTGEMHKLAILQASIEYVRYLHDCIEKLKARDPQTPTGRDDTMASSSQPVPHEAVEEEEDEEEHSPDVEMADSDSVSSTFSTHPSSSTTSLYQHQPDATNHRHGSYSSINSIEHHRHSSYSGSATTSPAMPPGGWAAVGYAVMLPTNDPGWTLTSPALGPMRERDSDQEATAALLMLNSDRRGTAAHGGSSASSGPARGMSVRDLLSS